MSQHGDARGAELVIFSVSIERDARGWLREQARRNGSRSVSAELRRLIRQAQEQEAAAA